ncbi:MAG TPA: metallophosphoesterase [Euryarchaeota archaeon]|nr:metallophosphoesterase [Euryarchaeota archaeon]
MWLMEIAVLADVHANLPALEAVLEDIGDLDVFCCGDLVGYNPFPNETVELFRRQGILGIMGNHDYAVVSGDSSRLNAPAKKVVEWTAKELSADNLKFLSSLPKSYEDERFSAFHGSPCDPLFDYIFQNTSDEILTSFIGKSSILILGHTHLPFTREIKGKLVLNPGSVGQPRDHNSRAAYAVLDLEKQSAVIRRVKYDVDSVAREIRRQGLPLEFAERLYSGD